MRRAAWLLGVAAAVATLPACSSAASPAAAPAEEPIATVDTIAPTPTTEPVPEAPARFSLAEPDIRAVRAPAEIPEDVHNAVQALLDRYLNDATVTPLKAARPVGDLSGVFAGPALERATGPDRPALLDEGLPRVARLHVGDASAVLTALVGPGGVAVVAAGIHVLIRGAVVGGALTIERSGELHLGRDGEEWRVRGYDVSVTRTGPEGVVTTSTTAGP